MPFTDLFIEYFPGYNKFRTVSMTLVIAEFTIPLLGFLALRDLFKDKIDKARVMKAFKIAGISVSAVLLVIIVAPGISNPETEKDGMLVEQIFAGTEENQQYQQTKVQMMNEYVPALQADRESLVRKDAFRSLIFVLLGALIVYLVIQRKIKPELAYALIFFVVIVDMWPVNRRYLDTDNFTSKRKFEKPFVASKADNEILKDKDIHYRVANMSVSIFNDASTSWFHRSIGGYHGAKIRRYQQLFDSVASQELSMVRGYANMMLQETQNMQEISNMINASVQTPALSMLNTKYIIIHPQLGPVKNTKACGNAWFVDSYKMVENADEEVVAVRGINPHKEAVIDKRFASQLNDFPRIKDDSADIEFIELVSYHPDHMVYESNSSKTQLAVFSEIYYPEGWHAYIDGEKHEHFRANYVLRAMLVPAGKHEIEFRFEPQSYKTGNTIQYAAAGVFFFLLLGGIFVERRKIGS